MSVPFGPFVLTLDDITRRIRRTFEQFTDPRQGKNTRYTVVDAGLSAFSVFFMQSPSFLEYQRSLEQAQGKNNAQTLFGVHQIPSDNQIRHLLDATEPGRVKPLFSYPFEALTQAGGDRELPRGEPDPAANLRWSGVFFLAHDPLPELFDPAPCQRSGDLFSCGPDAGVGEAGF